MTEYKLSRSSYPNKKLCVLTPEFDIINFGNKLYLDYPQYFIIDSKKAETRKNQFLLRNKHHDFTNLNNEKTWTKYILWNKKTITESIDDMEKLFDIKIVNYINTF